MKLIAARYDDVCLGCHKKIKPGELVFWEKKISYHRKCHNPVTITEKWLAR